MTPPTLLKHPSDRDILLALVNYRRAAGDVGSALEYAERLAKVTPDDPGVAGLIRELRRPARKPDAQ